MTPEQIAQDRELIKNATSVSVSMIEPYMDEVERLRAAPCKYSYVPLIAGAVIVFGIIAFICGSIFFISWYLI